LHDFEDIKIPGMSKWYNSMWEDGVRLHYVVSGSIQHHFPILTPSIVKWSDTAAPAH
jgi:phosphatidate phosphatase APP1